MKLFFMMQQLNSIELCVQLHDRFSTSWLLSSTFALT